MSIQSDWQPATTDEPAEFTLDYVEVKVQTVKNPDSDEIRVRIATEFDTDWMECKFDEWLLARDSDLEEAAKRAYPNLRAWRDRIKGVDCPADEWAAVNDLIRALEETNPGLIRG